MFFGLSSNLSKLPPFGGIFPFGDFMNIFVLDRNVDALVQAHVDKHVVKMILEHAQMLSTAVRLTLPEDKVGPAYKASYQKHPCTLWVMEALENWLWLREVTIRLNEEFMYRFDKKVWHKSATVVANLPIPELEDKSMTPFAMAMPDNIKEDDRVQAYRDYYNTHKRHLFKWTKRPVPEWVVLEI